MKKSKKGIEKMKEKECNNYQAMDTTSAEPSGALVLPARAGKLPAYYFIALGFAWEQLLQCWLHSSEETLAKPAVVWLVCIASIAVKFYSVETVKTMYPKWAVSA